MEARMSRYRLFSAVFLFMQVANAHAQSSDPAWLDDLTFQIATFKQCEVAYILNMREGSLGGQNTYEARVQCEDGRMFDASRIGDDAPFTFEKCEIQVC
jgi:hypothetical protein